MEEVPQNEKTTPFHPYSPYAVAKQYGYWIVKEYREAYGMFCCSTVFCSIMSPSAEERPSSQERSRWQQEESPQGLAGAAGSGQSVDSLSDWGYAKDYVECMWLILQHEKPEDFVIATGEQHTVRDITASRPSIMLASNWNLPVRAWTRRAIDKATGKVLVEVSPDVLPSDRRGKPVGRSHQGKNRAGLESYRKLAFEELVRIMAEHDMQKVAVERAEEHIKCNLEEYLEKGVVK